MTLSLPPRARIAVVRVLHLGDLLTAVPALHSLRAGYPDAEITLIGLPWAAALVERLPGYVDRFVPFGGYPGIVEAPYTAEKSTQFLAAQRAYGYDLVIQMHGSGGVSNPLALALEGKVTAGYFEGVAPGGLTYAAPYPRRLSEIERQLGLTRMLGCPDRGLALEFAPTADDQRAADRLLVPMSDGDGMRVGLHVGAHAPSRRWPVDRFALVAAHLRRRWGCSFVITGGRDESEDTAKLVDRLGHQGVPAPTVYDLTGKTSLGSLGAVLNRLDLLVSNDTGPAHLAEAVGTPTVRLFGPVDPARWAPLDRDRHRIVRRPVVCSPCGYTVCPIDHRCLEGVYPSAVSAAADDLLLRIAGARPRLQQKEPYECSA